MLTQLKQKPSFYLPGYPDMQDASLINYLEGSGNYSQVYIKSSPKPLLVSQTLKRLETQLPTFIRISKSALINPAYVERIIKVDTRTAYLKLGNGTCLPISRRRLGDTLARLGITLQGLGIATVDRVGSGRFKVNKPVQVRLGAGY